MNKNNIYYEQYTSKSIAVFGDTKDYKDMLKDMGGKFNRNLTNSEQETAPGWIFSNKKEANVKKFVDDINSTINPAKQVKSNVRTVAQKIEFPNVYAADDKEYQIIFFTVMLPKIGSSFTVRKNDSDDESNKTGTIGKILSENYPFDHIAVTFDDDDDNVEYEMKIINGKWKFVNTAEYVHENSYSIIF